MTPWRVFSARVNVSRIDFAPSSATPQLSPFAQMLLGISPTENGGGGAGRKRGAWPGRRDNSIRSKLAK